MTAHETFLPFALQHAANPGDHTPLMVGADALEEKGHLGLASLVRRAVHLHGKYPEGALARTWVGHFTPSYPGVDNFAKTHPSFANIHTTRLPYPGGTALPAHEWHIHLGPGEGAKDTTYLRLSAPLYKHEAESVWNSLDKNARNYLQSSIKAGWDVSEILPDNPYAQAASKKRVSKTGLPSVEPPAQLAAVVNQQYYGNGKFLAKALESIESAVARRRSKGRVAQLSGYASPTGVDLQKPVQMANQLHEFDTPVGRVRVHINEGYPKGLHGVSFGIVNSEHPDMEHTEAMNHGNLFGAAHVFEGVMRHVHNFIKTEKPNALTFTADLSDQKRVAVYDHVSKLLGHAHGYDVEHLDAPSARQYTLTRRDNTGPPAQLAKFPPGIATRKDTLTPEHIKEIEEAHGPNPPRLKYTVAPDGGIRTQVHELHEWFDQIGKRQGKLPASHKGKLTYLITHFGDAAKHFPNDGWYGKTLEHMEEGFTKAFPQIPAKTVKALIAITSPNQKPHVNIDTVFRMIHAGMKRNPANPVLGIPPLNQDVFDEWKEREKPDEAALKPGHDVHGLVHTTQFRGDKPGYSEAPYTLDKKTGKILRRLQPSERHNLATETTVKLPSVDIHGHLRAPGWGTASQSIQKALSKIQEQLKLGDHKGLHKWLDENTKEPTSVFGPKVSNFYRNLIGDKNLVTKDVWFSRTFNRLLHSLTHKGAEAPRNKTEAGVMDAAVRKTAEHMGMTPADLQAALWYHEQNLHRIFGARAESQDYAGGVKKALEKYGYTKSHG